MKKILSLLFCTAVILLAALPLGASAEERILRMDVRATVAPDATVTVRETIEALAEGREIKRGIIRVFPTDYVDTRGRTMRTDFKLVSVKVDGRDAPAQTSREGGSIEIRIGDPDRMLSRGTHRFEITYTTKGWVAFRDSYDELFWNVTGNDWIFPIDAATFAVSLPGGVKPDRLIGFTGVKGAKGTDYAALPEGSVATTKPLAPGEGFSVAVGWPKGIVMKPSASSLGGIIDFIAEYRLPVAILFVMIVSLYYFAAWYHVGKDPDKGTIVPNWRPPEGVEPGFAAYMRDMKYSQRCLVADIIQLAVLGFAYFESDGDTIRIMPTPKATGDGAENSTTELSEPLRNLADGLFMGAGRGGVLVKDVNGDVFDRVNKRLEFDYEKRAHRYFSRNVGYSLFGVVLFIPMLAVIALLDTSWFDLGVMIEPLLFVGILAAKVFNRSIFGIFAAVAAFFVAAMLFNFDLVLMGGVIVGAIVAFVFGRIMPARTPKGARLQADIEGLAMYMGTAERHRLAMLNPPDETPKLFEALLPYAYALDCADTWVDSFAETLKKVSFTPQWDRTRRFDAFDWMTFNSRIGMGLTRGINSSVKSHKAAQAASSRSYGGGGGFGGGGGSGMGGGGGGGRGW